MKSKKMQQMLDSLKKTLKGMAEYFIYIMSDTRGEIYLGDNPHEEKLKKGEPKKEKIEEVEIGGVIYRLTAEYYDNVDFDKSVAEWAIRKAADELNEQEYDDGMSML